MKSNYWVMLLCLLASGFIGCSDDDGDNWKKTFEDEQARIKDFVYSKDSDPKIFKYHYTYLKEDIEDYAYLFNYQKEGKKATYALLEERVPPVKELTKDEALATLALRYFRSHSPATLKDFVWWSGLTVTEAQQAIGSIKELLVEEHFEGQAFWVFAACRKTENRDLIQLLPPFDEYLVSYKDSGKAPFESF